MGTNGRQQEVAQESYKEAMVRAKEHIDRMLQQAIDFGHSVESIHFTRDGELKGISFYVE